MVAEMERFNKEQREIVSKIEAISKTSRETGWVADLAGIDITAG
jgi:hypothetical protein